VTSPNQKRKKRYGIDLDGVCFDFIGGFVKWLNTTKNLDIKPEQATNYWWTGITEELKARIWGEYFHEFCRAGGMATLKPIPGAIFGLRQLRNHAEEIHFVTSREDYVEADTIYAIEMRLFHKNPNVHIVKGKEKSPYVKKLALDVVIDDSPSTLTDLITNTRASVYIMDYEYNREVDAEGLYSTRVTNWYEFLEKEGITRDA
jgi:uncharacterized HAD superfamily protein